MDSCKTIGIVAIGIALILGYFFYDNANKQDVSVYTEEIKKLKIQNDTLLAKNKALDENIFFLKASQDSIKKVLEIKRKKIEELKQINHEKIKAIEHFTNDKLFHFFSEFNTDSTRVEW